MPNMSGSLIFFMFEITKLVISDKTCLDIDECTMNCTSTVGPKPSCINTPGSYMCTCLQGMCII